MGQWIELVAADGFALPAWQEQPAGTPRGAVVLLQEIFGVNSHIRDVAARLAARGYAVVAPATFARVEKGVELGYGDADMQRGKQLKAAVEALPAPGVLPDLQAAIDFAAQDSGARVGIVGFCWGGLLAWRAACALHGLSAAVPYYGGGMTTKAEAASTPRVPVLAHFGRRDHFISEKSVHDFAAAHPEVRVELYDADHGFHCDQRASYDAPAAQLAWTRTLDFLDQHLQAK
ncbi:carboxymethylenebutenolidase [Oryzisolibacter propanilivorax]|uniref:Carboxymethylenebutenolidase n=1 Tax=Oryzisolibacter propanilivorax TaxID=1527607 RepID=A0A1G9QSK2_9BURK|nr:dienelactone hydrolase family protein [Oryzisolibacter propanilivorax]SDM13976.1 carboxymethylenebutenolidase [Oryzisolibacter propanilivorax]